MLIYLALIDSDEDKSKFADVYNSYRKTMCYVANQILNDHYLAEDAVQEAFIRIAANIAKIGEVKCHKTRAFVVIIVHNIAIDIYRRRKKHPDISYDEIDGLILGNPAYKCVGTDILTDAILAMPIIYSSVFMLKYSQGYSDREIAEILKISEATIRKRIARGKKKLAEALQEERVMLL